MDLLNISAGWVEHSNLSGTWSVPVSIKTCSSTLKLWAVESIIVKLIFSKRSLGSTPLHVARILSIASLACARFSLLSLAMGRVGNSLNVPFMVTPSSMNDPTPFFFESSSWYVMTDSSDAIISSTMHFSVCFNSPSCLSDIFGTRRCIGINTCWVLIVVFRLSAKHLVGNSYHSWNRLVFGAVARADEFFNSSIEFRLYSFDELLYMVKFLWEFVRGSLHNIRDASHFYGSWDITITIWYCVSSFIYSILSVLLTSSCTFTWLQIRWKPFPQYSFGARTLFIFLFFFILS